MCYLQRRNQLHYLARHIPCCSGVWMRLPNTSQRPGGNACDCRSEIWCASSTSSLSPGEALSILASRSTSRRRQHVYCPLAQALHQQLQLPPGIVLAPATHYFRAREWCSQRHEIAPHAPACPVPSAGLLAAAMCATLRHRITSGSSVSSRTPCEQGRMPSCTWPSREICSVLLCEDATTLDSARFDVAALPPDRLRLVFAVSGGIPDVMPS